ncbi:unnamed protein product [Callosobruchus maculatus]|uniref:Uncharacterized protein n=1 Tax=Callosobruchus maculatus TaxID=64391 RepID=A0A653DF20_CALMS|nr:unnamed protein product [Callosobruchus maculatus]
MTDDNDQKYETTYIFDDVEVRGNVNFGQDGDHKPNLTRIDQEAVKTSGVFNIRGRKRYQKELIAKNLVVERLAGIETSNLLSTKTSNITIKGRKIFENLTVLGNLTLTNKNKVNRINNVKIEHLLEDIIYIDRPQNLTRLDFERIRAANIHVTRLNEKPTEHYQKVLESTKTNGRIKKLHIKSDVTLNSLKNISTINGMKVEDLEKKMMNMGKHGLKANVQFNGRIKVNNLITAFINDINLRKLFSRILNKNGDQNITAAWSFRSIKTENLETTAINDYDVENLIDVSSEKAQLMYMPNGTEFMDLVTAKSIEAPHMKPCSLDDIVEYINNPPTQEWKQVHVEGNVTVLEPDGLINRILEKTAKRGEVNVIQAPVTFASDVMAKNINTSVDINNINITEIMHDAVLIDSEETQRISGQKWFKSVKATSAVVLRNADIPFVNDEDVRKLDADIVDKNIIHNYTIKGKKTFFGGLKTKNLNVQVLGDVQTKDIVLGDPIKPIPSAVFEYVEVQSNLNVKNVNNISVQKVLENRILLNGPMPQRTAAIVYFDDVIVQNVTASTINKVKVDDVVFDIGDQTILSKKSFSKDIEVFGNVTTDLINGVNITQYYENAVLSNKDIFVNGSAIFKKPSHISGALQTEAINSCPVTLIKDVLRKGSAELAAKEVQDVKGRITRNIARTLPIAQALESEFMYLEKSKNLQIQVPNSMDTTAVQLKDYVLLHVTGEEPGPRCSLAESCRCPVHQTLEISPQRTVTDMPTKGVMRVFSYDDDTMIIHFISNSVSYNSTCRTDESKLFNEYSAMSWNTYNTSTTSAGFHQHEDVFLGYIRKVEFFSLHGKTYAIVGTFYDPVLDSYDLNCIVYKFEGAKTKAKEIQRIPTKGVREVYILHTAQGVTLILGNSKDSDLYHEEEETQILRFNENIEQFIPLRSLPFGCIQATGVVFGTESLIVLAHKTMPVQILKYYPEYDNYYFYQNFNEIEAPVVGISSFYTGGFGISDAFLSVVTSNSDIYIYSFKFIVGWNLEIKMRIEGATELVPFEVNGESLLFVSSSRNSSILTVVKNGPN